MAKISGISSNAAFSMLAAARVEGAELVTEHCRYRAIVVPSARYLPAACLRVLQQFAAAGGQVIFTGALPEQEAETQASLAAEVGALLEQATVAQVEASGAQVRDALATRLRPALVLEGEDRREFISSWRRIADSDVLFLANMARRDTEVTVRTDLDGPLAVVDPFSLQAYRPAVEAGAIRWRFAPWQAILLVSGPAAAALGEGRLDAAWAVLGMLAGAGVYAEAYPWLKATALTWGDFGKITLPQALGVNHWLVILAVAVLSLLLFCWLERAEAAGRQEMNLLKSRRDRF